MVCDKAYPLFFESSPFLCIRSLVSLQILNPLSTDVGWTLIQPGGAFTCFPGLPLTIGISY